jgi:hypothetical protein
MPIGTEFNVTIEDTDPIVSFAPYGDGDAIGGWVTTYSGGTIPGMTNLPRTWGVGASTHVTQKNGASLSIGFFGILIRRGVRFCVYGIFSGNAVYLLGTSNGTQYSVSIDEQPYVQASESNGILATFTGLSLSNHNISLLVTSGQTQFGFDKAIVTVGTGING